jgi:hypothetical protein
MLSTILTVNPSVSHATGFLKACRNLFKANNRGNSLPTEAHAAEVLAESNHYLALKEGDNLVIRKKEGANEILFSQTQYDSLPALAFNSTEAALVIVTSIHIEAFDFATQKMKVISIGIRDQESISSARL